MIIIEYAILRQQKWENPRETTLICIIDILAKLKRKIYFLRSDNETRKKIKIGQYFRQKHLQFYDGESTFKAWVDFLDF